MTLNQRRGFLGLACLLINGLIAQVACGMQDSPQSPAVEPESSPSAWERATPATKKILTEHAKFYARSSDGTLWDRQLWLRREALLKGSPPKTPDEPRALGVKPNSLESLTKELKELGDRNRKVPDSLVKQLQPLLSENFATDIVSVPLFYGKDRTLTRPMEIEIEIGNGLVFTAAPLSVQEYDPKTEIAVLSANLVDDLSHLEVRVPEMVMRLSLLHSPWTVVGPISRNHREFVLVPDPETGVMCKQFPPNGNERGKPATFCRIADRKAPGWKSPSDVDPQELAQAVEDGTVELGTFQYSKSRVHRITHAGSPLELAEFKWSRTRVPTSFAKQARSDLKPNGQNK